MASLNNQAALTRLNSGMPLLDHLECGLRAKRQLGRLLRIHGPPTKRGLQIADGYVRLVEKATLEYAESRKQLVLFLDEGLVDALFRAQDHFESCINSTHRAINYLDR